jgi:hypothetical protein
MEHKLFISLGIILILTMGIKVLEPIFGLQCPDDKKYYSEKYYSEECDSLTEEGLSKLDLTKPDPC